jgi:hypothetical protein
MTELLIHWQHRWESGQANWPTDLERSTIARVEWAGVGRSIPIARLTLEGLRIAVRAVLDDPAYRVRAGLLQSNIEAADGLNRAADLIESAFGTRRRDDVSPEVIQHTGANSDRVRERRPRRDS